jgi:16S rRNA (uracil1498-N3)-methyltransferase
MPHFFVPPKNIVDGTFILTGPEAHHLATVRRCQPGSTLQLFDGTGKTYVGTVKTVSHNELSGTVVLEKETPGPKADIRLYNAVPKGDRFDWLVEKAAELGVTALIPIITERSVVKDISSAKVDRWNRLSLAASQQSGRRDIMQVSAPTPFDAAVGSVISPAVGVIPWEGEEARTLREIPSLSQAGTAVSIFIGPEGGFSSQEIGRAVNSAIIPVTLGQNILRVETAGILATVLVMNLAGQYS